MQAYIQSSPAGSGTLAILALLLLLLLFYLAGVIHERRRGRRWSRWRTLSFVLGTGLLALAIYPPLAQFAHHDLRGHMLQHLLLGMFAPLPLVLAAPGTLLLRVLPAHSARVLVRLLATRPVRVLTHPISTLLFNIGGMYVLYLTPLYLASLHNSALHVLVHVHFVIAGYVFTWAIAGPDPAPHRPGLRLRLAVLLVATGTHAALAKMMYGYGWPRGTGHSLGELQAAAQWMYYGGDLAELFLIIAFFSLWFRRQRYGAQTWQLCGPLSVSKKLVVVPNASGCGRRDRDIPAAVASRRPRFRLD